MPGGNRPHQHRLFTRLTCETNTGYVTVSGVRDVERAAISARTNVGTVQLGRTGHRHELNQSGSDGRSLVLHTNTGDVTIHP